MKILLAALLAASAVAVTAPAVSAQPYGPGPGWHHGYGPPPGWAGPHYYWHGRHWHNRVWAWDRYHHRHYWRYY